MVDVKSGGSEDFDFMGEKTQVAGAKPETATGGSPKPSRSRRKKATAPEAPGLTDDIIREAQKLAQTPKGLDIEAFVQKHKLVSLDVEAVLSHQFE